MNDDILYPPSPASATLPRIVHCCIDIRGMLWWPKRRLRGLMVDDAGKRLTPEQAREYLLDQIALGRRVLPLGGECEGFSYETGCPGHQEPST